MTDEDFTKKIGENIKKYRKDQSLTQQELAYRCNFEKSNLVRIEMGRTNPTALTLKKLAEALEIEVSSLLEF